MDKQFTLNSADASSEPCQESKMNLVQCLTVFAKGSIMDVWQGSEYTLFSKSSKQTNQIR